MLRSSNKEVANLGLSVCSDQGGGEPNKRKKSVAVAKTFDVTQEGKEIASLKFRVKEDFLHGVSAIPVTSILQKVRKQIVNKFRHLASRHDLFKSARRNATRWVFFNKVMRMVEAPTLCHMNNSNVVQSSKKNPFSQESLLLAHKNLSASLHVMSKNETHS